MRNDLTQVRQSARSPGYFVNHESNWRLTSSWGMPSPRSNSSNPSRTAAAYSSSVSCAHVTSSDNLLITCSAVSLALISYLRQQGSLERHVSSTARRAGTILAEGTHPGTHANKRRALKGPT